MYDAGRTGSKQIEKSYRFVDLIFGTHNIFRFAELLVKAMEEKQMTVEIWEGTQQIVENLPNERKYFLNPVSMLCTDATISAATVLFLM